MRLERLIAIIMVLLNQKKISATKLAEMFEVTPRTIYRDIDAINQAGIPIVSHPGVHGGISITEEYKVDKKLFTTLDIANLLIGLGTLSSALASEEMVTTLAKVKSLIPAEESRNVTSKSNQIAIDLTFWTGNQITQAYFTQIREGLDKNRYLVLQYLDGNGRSSERKIEPYQLIFKESNWYLYAYCTLRQDFRLFKVSRISKLSIATENFLPREFPARPLEGSDWVDDRLIQVQLLIDPSLRERIADRCGEENIKPYNKNRLLVNCPFTEDEQGYNFLLSLGNKCECLGPDHVREELTDRIEKMLRIYRL